MEAGKSKIKLPAWLKEALLVVHSWHLLIVTSPGGTDWGSPWSLFSKGTNPTHEGSTFMTSVLPEDPTSSYHHLLVTEFQHMNLEETQILRP